ncbi:MAG: WxcM-like domain-containing protein, partial [Bacteroidaceae bacterium]|nr:WxcM-like domain-containing protein [Bacteroidaceae bacterium]
REFTTGALCLVLASHPYSEEDYIRNFDEYLSIYKR